MAGHAALIGSWVRTVPPDGRHWKGGGGTGSQRVGFVTPPYRQGKVSCTLLYVLRLSGGPVPSRGCCILGTQLALLSILIGADCDIRVVVRLWRASWISRLHLPP